MLGLSINRSKLFVLVIFIFSIYSCNTLTGHRGISENIEDSEKNKLFISEYRSNKETININDTTEIKFKSIWLEHQWAYSKEGEAIIIPDLYQLILETEKTNLKGCGRQWTIGIDFDKNMRKCGENCLIADMKVVPNDTDRWQIQQGSILISKETKDIIGEFLLIKKNN